MKMFSQLYKQVFAAESRFVLFHFGGYIGLFSSIQKCLCIMCLHCKRVTYILGVK